MSTEAKNLQVPLRSDVHDGFHCIESKERSRLRVIPPEPHRKSNEDLLAVGRDRVVGNARGAKRKQNDHSDSEALGFGTYGQQYVQR